MSRKPRSENMAVNIFHKCCTDFREAKEDGKIVLKNGGWFMGKEGGFQTAITICPFCFKKLTRE